MARALYTAPAAEAQIAHLKQHIARLEEENQRLRRELATHQCAPEWSDPGLMQPIAVGAGDTAVSPCI